MKVVTGAEMRQLENKAFESLGLSPLVVMENAGSRILETLKERFGPLTSKRIHILAGPGNNGGDGSVVARQLLATGARVKVYLVGNRQKSSKENRTNLAVLERLGVDFVKVDGGQLGKLRFSLGLADLIIDAVLGTGFSGSLDSELDSLIGLVNEVQCPVVSIDCPTGVNSTTGEVLSTAIKADLTINLGLPKVGCLLYPGQMYAGNNLVVDLGFPLPIQGLSRELLDDQALEWLPTRLPWSHKGTFGHTLVVAGSTPYAGAAYLSSQAILRGGGGLVTVAVPEGIYERFPPDELIVVPVAQTETGAFGHASVTKLMNLLEGKDVLSIGPGLGREGETLRTVQKVLDNWDKPAVIDADGLFALDQQFLEQVPRTKRKKWIITPHPGEMARIIGVDAPTVNSDRIGVASQFAQKWDLVVVLKGAPTIIASPEATYINSTGNHGLATAGTGDILTGLIASMLAQGLEPIKAAAVGVYVHGKAGDLAGAQGRRGLKASDCLQFIQEILQ